MEMLRDVSKALKIKEIRSKLIFTIIVLIIFRIGSNIPVPGIDHEYMAQLFAGDNVGLLQLFNLFSGGAFSNFTIFALGVTPYITSSIIMQLLTVAFPRFERMAREGMEGRKKITKITRYLTVILAVIQALALTVGLLRSAIANRNALNIVVITIILTAGATLLMWLGEKINERGVGNGMSLLVFAGIIARMPSMVGTIVSSVKEGNTSVVTFIIFIVIAVLIILGIIMIQQGTRKIPVQYAKRVVGRKMYGGQSTHIPMKVNQAGVIPIIFAISLLQLPLTIMNFFPDTGFYNFCYKWLSPAGSPGVFVYAVLNVILIFLFNYFYTAVTFNPIEISQNLKSNGGFIPGVRPGRATVEYLSGIMNKLSIVGAIFLAVVATLPTIVSQYTGWDISFGGTSILIAVGVALDTMQQIQNQLMMRNYKGFL